MTQRDRRIAAALRELAAALEADGEEPAEAPKRRQRREPMRVRITDEDRAWAAKKMRSLGISPRVRP